MYNIPSKINILRSHLWYLNSSKFLICQSQPRKIINILSKEIRQHVLTQNVPSNELRAWLSRSRRRFSSCPDTSLSADWPILLAQCILSSSAHSTEHGRTWRRPARAVDHRSRPPRAPEATWQIDRAGSVAVWWTSNFSGPKNFSTCRARFLVTIEKILYGKFSL